MWLTHPASFLSSGSSGLWLSYTHPGLPGYSREHLKNVSSCQCPLTWFPCSGLKILQPLSHSRGTRVPHCWCLCAKYFNKCSLMVVKVDFVPSEQVSESKVVMIGFDKKAKKPKRLSFMSSFKVKIEMLVYLMTLGGKNSIVFIGVEKPLIVSFSDPIKIWGSEFSREIFILSLGKTKQTKKSSHAILGCGWTQFSHSINTYWLWTMAGDYAKFRR